jgi:hypothetical protein
MLYRALIKVENSIFHGNENNAHLLEIMIKHIYIYIYMGRKKSNTAPNSRWWQKKIFDIMNKLYIHIYQMIVQSFLT